MCKFIKGKIKFILSLYLSFLLQIAVAIIFSLSDTLKVYIPSEILGGGEKRVSLIQIYSALLSLHSNVEYLMVLS